MKILLPPISYEALTQIGKHAVRWVAAFDPFGPAHSRLS
ncbi:MAG: hypothetical protein QOK15_808 [Nocardioidaceae bacterium]|jgi:hypothetical protein|nr:hypothetical protein [Nocardioidaceae bacterium]